MKRRDFIKQSAFVTAGTLLVPSFLKNLGMEEPGDKKLVVVQLSGGNDGLNTIVPFENPVYHNSRTQLALKENEIIRINETLAFNKSLEALRPVWDQGYMSVLNGVGYPNPDRSHFRSLDIWHTASDANEYLNTGWIGRYLDSECPGCEKAWAAVEVDDSLSLAMKGKNKNGFAVKDTGLLYRNTKEPFFAGVTNAQKPDMLNEDNQGYLYKVMADTASGAEFIFEKTKTAVSKHEYPESAFAKQLKQVAQFIRSGINTRVYYVSLGGFDTHNNQRGRQDRLLKQWAEGIRAFMKDMKDAGQADNVLVMTFSEFGRRVSQNASGGTDHGTANNLFLFGGKLKKSGFLNDMPSLNNLDNGDLIYAQDFKNVYATLLEKWLGIDHQKVLNRKYNMLDFI
ncbi:MAG: hypothetical protein FD123_1805 [Bacteroidetes bacterium]|nr:MAG: hypothetical protein FD123_1805 [Bacteroidota bacterium]